MPANPQDLLADLESGLKLAAGAATDLESLGVPIPGGPLVPIAMRAAASALTVFNSPTPEARAILKEHTAALLNQCHADMAAEIGHTA